MLALITPGNAYRASYDECPNCCDETLRQRNNGLLLLVTERKQFLIVLYVPDHGLGVVPKHPVGPEIIRGGIQTHNEVPWEQIFTTHFIVCVGINENVCERCRRISDVAASREHGEELADLP